MRHASALALAVLAAGLAHAQPPAPAKGESLAGFGWFAELVGSCWKGDHPGGTGSDTQCYTLQYERVIRGTIEVASRGPGGAETFRGDSAFAADPSRKRVVYAQWGSTGALASGEIGFEGEALVFVNRTADGAPPTVRSVWRRAGADGFRVTRERKDEAGWKPLFDVEYRRVR
jgi:hypothetical protein